MSRNAKIVVGILGALTLVCLCAAMVAALALRQASQAIQAGTSDDPTEVETAVRAMTDFDMPAGYEGQFKMGLFGFEMAALGPTSTGNGPVFLLMQMPSVGGDPEEMQRQMEEAMQRQTGQGNAQLEVVETRPVTVRGEETTMTISEGEADEGQQVRQASLVFPGNNGPVMLMVTGSASTWDEALVDEFIASLR